MTSAALTTDRELPERLQWLCLDASTRMGCHRPNWLRGRTKLFENHLGEEPRSGRARTVSPWKARSLTLMAPIAGDRAATCR